MSRSPLSATIMVSSTSSHNWRTAKSKRQQLALGKNNNNTGGGGGGSTSNTMSEKGRTKNKKHHSDQDIHMMIGGLKEKHAQMLVFLKSELEDCKLEQEEVLSTGLMKLPKAVRNMSIQAFNAQHSCDLLSLLKSKDGVVVTGTGTGVGTGTAGVVSKKNMNDDDMNNKDATKKRCFETPAPRNRRVGWGAAPGTVVRTARRGEGI